MSARPAYRKLLVELHEFEQNEEAGPDTCKCALPRWNRHHKTTEKPAQPSDESPQLRLDIDG